MICHVGTRGDRHDPIYMDERDRWQFLHLLTRVAFDAEWHVLSYCFMGNHYHLLLEVPHGNLAHGMHRLNSTFASRFNRRHDYVGSHLFQKRYFSRLIQDYRHLLVAFTYVALNPVEARIARHAELWPWASTGALLGLRAPTAVLAHQRALELIHHDPLRARQRLRDSIRFPERKRLLLEPTPANIRDLHAYHDLSFTELAAHFRLSKATISRLAAQRETKVPGTFVSPANAVDKPPDLAT